LTNKDKIFIVGFMHTQTQKQTAKLLNITPQHLNAVLRGRTRPSLQLALGIEHVMGIPREAFIPELSSGRKEGCDLRANHCPEQDNG